MDGDFEEILGLARQLGEAMRRHPRYARLRETDAGVRADTSATDALAAFNKAAADLQRKERQMQPIEPDEKRAIDRLRQVVAANEAVKAFLRAQADYAELMKRMNDAIYQAIAEEKLPTVKG